jgi:hypothetical protein
MGSRWGPGCAHVQATYEEEVEVGIGEGKEARLEEGRGLEGGPLRIREDRLFEVDPAEVKDARVEPHRDREALDGARRGRVEEVRCALLAAVDDGRAPPAHAGGRVGRRGRGGGAVGARKRVHRRIGSRVRVGHGQGTGEHGAAPEEPVAEHRDVLRFDPAVVVRIEGVDAGKRRRRRDEAPCEGAHIRQGDPPVPVGVAAQEIGGGRRLRGHGLAGEEKPADEHPPRQGGSDSRGRLAHGHSLRPDLPVPAILLPRAGFVSSRPRVERVERDPFSSSRRRGTAPSSTSRAA